MSLNMTYSTSMHTLSLEHALKCHTDDFLNIVTCTQNRFPELGYEKRNAFGAVSRSDLQFFT